MHYRSTLANEAAHALLVNKHVSPASHNTANIKSCAHKKSEERQTL